MNIPPIHEIETYIAELFGLGTLVLLCVHRLRDEVARFDKRGQARTSKHRTPKKRAKRRRRTQRLDDS